MKMGKLNVKRQLQNRLRWLEMNEDERRAIEKKIKELQDKLSDVRKCKHCKNEIWKIPGGRNGVWVHRDSSNIWCKISKAEPKDEQNEVMDEISQYQEQFKNMNQTEILPLRSDEKIEEIWIRKIDVLSTVAKDEVFKKLNAMLTSFNYKGYVKISYGGVPFRIISVDPLEGTATEYCDTVFK